MASAFASALISPALADCSRLAMPLVYSMMLKARYVIFAMATVSAEAILVRKGRSEETMPSSRVPCRYSLYSTVFMIEIIIMR